MSAKDTYGTTKRIEVLNGDLELDAKSESVKVLGTTNATSTSTGALVVDGGVGIAKDLHLGGSLVLGGSVSSGSGGATEILDNTVETNTFIGNLVESSCDLDITAGCSLRMTAAEEMTIKASDVFEIQALGASNSLSLMSEGDIRLNADGNIKFISEDVTTSSNLNINVNGNLNFTTDYTSVNATNVFLGSQTDAIIATSIDFYVMSDGNIFLNSNSGNNTINANNVAINSDTLELQANTLELQADTLELKDDMVVSSDRVEFEIEKSFFYGTGESLNSQTARMSFVPRLQIHEDGSGQATMMISKDHSGDGDTYLAFVYVDAGGPSSRVTGKIRGSFHTYPTVSNAFVTQTSANGTAIAPNLSPVKVNTVDDVVFASGNADFGEWIECGDLLEWEEYQKKENQSIPNQVCLPEGIVVTIRNGKFYKEGSGCKALITNSALLVGNEGDKSESWYGSIISFAGQIHVYIEGGCKSGDYVVPKENENYCIAIDKDEISFSDYKSALGTVLEDSEGEGFKRILCAIGIK